MSTSALMRLSLVRFGASFLLILTTGILNRILIADLAVTAFVVTLVLSFQHLTSPFALLSGHISDRRPIRGRHRVPYIRGWTAISAALVPLMPFVAFRMGDGWFWVCAGAVLFGVFGFGLKAANLLVGALLVDITPDPDQRGRQLNVIWIMAIVGFIAAGFLFSIWLPVFDPSVPTDVLRLEHLCWLTAGIALGLTWLGTTGFERVPSDPAQRPAPRPRAPLFSAVREVLAKPSARLLFGFLVLADFSFFVQEFVLEAFGGEVFDLPVAVTTSFNITFGAGMVCSMIGAGSLGTLLSRFPTRRVLASSCALGAFSFGVLAFSAVADAATALHTSVFVLGVAKGLYNVGLAHLFMGLANSRTAGVLMGAWGAFGGFAVALGGLSGGLLQGVAEGLFDDLALSYGAVFAVELVGMIAAMVIILRARLGDA